MAPLQFCGEQRESSVSDFYAHKSLFITGGTGFLGKVIIEKLLFSCRDIHKVYILVREKRTLSIHQRMQNLVDSLVFERIRSACPQQLHKIVPVCGDVLLPGLGIKPKDEAILLKEVSVVIHSAATVKFNEDLKTALNVNYEGTKRVLTLCKKMKNIQVLVHVSTVYTNLLQEVIEEKMYPSPIHIDELYERLHNFNGKDISKLLCGRPNTYIFTKSLAEILVKENRGDIPTLIIRPSIVVPSQAEPIEGWIDSWHGATAFLSAVAKGLCRAMVSQRHYILDIIPVDCVANLILAAAARHTKNELKVFNSCTSSTNPITMSQVANFFTENTVRDNCHDLPFPGVFMTKHRWLVLLISMFTEIIPAYVADLWLILWKKPTRFVKIQKQVTDVRNILEYFTAHSWIIRTSAPAIAASLSAEDAKLFPCDPSYISWKEYMATYFSGVKRFLYKNRSKI